MNRLRKSPDENLLQYQLRLFKNKDTYDLSFQEITNLINEETGQNYGESKYRKYMTPFIDGYDFAIRNNLDIQDAMDELAKERKEFEIAKIQFQDQRREYRKYLRHEGRLKHLLKEMVDEFEIEMDKKPLDWFKRIEPTGSKRAGVLMLSDLHNEMVTDNHWNTFNEDVFYERLNQVVNETIDYKFYHNLDELHIFQLGDLIEGSLHRLTRIKETETATRAIQRVAEKLSEMIATLANTYPSVKFYSVAGNHDRVASRKEEEIRTESFHEFVPWYMEARLKDFDNVEIVKNEYDSEIIVADILNNTYFGVHGHLDNLGQVVQNLTLMIQKFPTAVLSGHIHKNFENEVHSVDIIVNGGFAGTNDYAKDRRLTSKAHQKFLIVDEKGRKSTEYIRF